jgi:hypothetical protein
MALDIAGSLTNLLPSTNSLITDLIAGAAGTVVISGLKSGSGQDALDPMHWFHHPESNTTGVVQGSNVITMSKFLALTPDQQKMFQALNYTIIPG